jgi:hypothetical protein
MFKPEGFVSLEKFVADRPIAQAITSLPLKCMGANEHAVASTSCPVQSDLKVYTLFETGVIITYALRKLLE